MGIGKFEKYLIDFNKIKKGDKLYSSRYGWVSVTDIYPTTMYCIRTDTHSFTKDGKELDSDINPTLFTTNIYEVDDVVGYNKF